MLFRVDNAALLLGLIVGVSVVSAQQLVCWEEGGVGTIGADPADCPDGYVPRADPGCPLDVDLAPQVLWDAALNPPGPRCFTAAEQLAAQRLRTSITALQGELQLLATPDPTGQHANAYEAVLAWAETQDAETQAFFRRQPVWRRMSPVILAGAEHFGWTAEDLDNLFAAAAQR